MILVNIGFQNMIGIVSTSVNVGELLTTLARNGLCSMVFKTYEREMGMLSK